MEARFPGLGAAVSTNRGAVIALGCFGARALAHLWPRMRFEDFQRDLLRHGLPLLRRTVGFSLLLPMERGGFVVGTLDPEQWDDDLFVRRVARLRPVRWEAEIDAIPAPDSDQERANRRLYAEELPASLLGGRRLVVPGEAAGSDRQAYFRAALDHLTRLRDHFVQMADAVRVDQDAPGHEATRFTIYVMAGLHEPAATAFLWPVVMTLRQQLEPYLALEVVGLLSTGAFGSQVERQLQGAAIHAALQELRHFSRPGPRADWFDLPPDLTDWLEGPCLDRCYLLDSEKRNLSRPKDEDEVIVAIGNALELLLLSEAPDLIAAYLGPDQAMLQADGPFGTLGTASVYIPIGDWRAHHRQKYMLDILQEQFLQPETGEAWGQRVRITADEVDERLCALDGLLRQMVSECPFSLRGARESWGVIGDLLRRARLDQPLTGEGPGRPLPLVRLDPEVARPEYVALDPDTGQQRRLDPEEWLAHLYQHYRRLGLDEENIFPGDPELPAMRAQPAPVRTHAEEWYEQMLLACDSRVAPALIDTPAAPGLEIEAQEASGIVPEMQRELRSQVAEHLRQGNEGVVLATALLDELGRRLRGRTRQVADYRVRLERAFNSDAMAGARERAAELRLRFRRQLADRPRVSGLISRGLMLAMLCAVFLYYGVPVRYPQIGRLQLLYGSLAAGVVLAFLVGSAIWAWHHWRLRQTLGHIEDGLATLLDLQVNHTIAQLMVSEAGEGLLPDLSELLAAHGKALDATVAELREREADLERLLSEPLTIQEPFLRQPLPGLEELKRQLQAEAGGISEDGALPPLVDADPRGAAALLEPLIAQEVTRAGGPASELSAPATYYSLGDLLMSVIERHASRLGEILPPNDLKIERLLRTHLPTHHPQAFLAELQRRMQPMLNWDDEQLAPGFPVELELLALDEPAYSRDLAPFATNMRLRPVATLDPFSITSLRLIHGLRIEAVSHFQVYARDFRAVGPTKRANLVLAPDALEKTGEYFAEAKEEVADAGPHW